MLSEKLRAIFSFPILLATLVAFWVYLRIYEMAISFPMQFLIHTLIGGGGRVMNLGSFLVLLALGL